MSLSTVLAEKKAVIFEEWLDRVLGTYHKDGVKFFKGVEDRFANPLGHSARVGLEKFVYDLAAGREPELSSEFRQFLKLRAVQKLSPTEALSFIFDLKGIIVKACGSKEVGGHLKEWLEIEGRLEAAALKIFEMYNADRERLYQVTLQEYKSGNVMAVRGGCPSGAMVKEQNKELKEIKVVRET